MPPGGRLSLLRRHGAPRMTRWQAAIFVVVAFLFWGLPGALIFGGLIYLFDFRPSRKAPRR